MKLWLYGLLALAILGALGGIYATGYSAGSTSKQNEWNEASRIQHAREEKQGATAAGALETTRAKERVVFRTITQAVDRIVDRPVYRSVCLDADGLRVAQCAIRGQSADSCKPDQPMPGTKPAGGWNGGNGLTLDYGDRGPISRLLREAAQPG